MTVSPPAGTPPGLYPLTVSAAVTGANTVNAYVLVTVAGPSDVGFTLSSSPGWQQLAVGGNAQYTIGAVPANGFMGDINLYCAGLPAGVTAAFSANPITASAGYSGTLTLSADGSAPYGTTATCTLVGSSGSVASETFANAQIVSAPSQSYGTTITTSPAGLSLIVDGSACTAPCTFQWVAGTTHTIGTTQTQGSNGTQYVFSGWSDSGALTHNITVSSTGTYTASFLTQYYLTTTATNGGSITPPSAYYSSGQQVTVTAPAIASNGAVFTGFSGALSGMSTQQNLVMVGPQGVAANFTPIPANVPVSALPISETVAAPGAATYAVAVTSVAGLSGTVTLAVSGLPQGATATFSPQTLGATGTSSLTVSVGAASPVGTYPLTITASNGLIAPTTMAFLTIVAPSPANMISPATGSNLSAGSTTFAWDSGMGVSQFQLVLGSTPGGSDLFTGSAGTSQSATVTLPASSQQEHAALSPTSSSMRFLGDYDSAMLEKDGSSPKNASGSFTWYAATSCTFDPNTGDTLISHTFDPAGDNQAGKGTTLTTYNLQPPQQ